MSCATDVQIQIFTSPVQIVYSTFQVLLFLGTVIGSVLAVVGLARKSTIPDSTRVLLIGSLLFANAHEFAFVSQALKVFRLNFFNSDPSCYPLESTLECVPTITVLTMGISGNMLIQSALSVDRLLATVFPQAYTKLNALPGFILLIVVIIPSIFTFSLIRVDAVLDDYQLFCSNFSTKVSSRANSYLEYCSYSTIVHIVINLFVIWKNRVDEKKARFNVNEQYHTSETLKTTKAICYLLIAQILAMFLYTGGVLFMRKNRENIPTLVYFNVIVWVYVSLL
uniref:G_PROTEIN_RECEP_F1_2 domain-containing protein n=1 Tax=Caenorhabditis japonica TaxID=281687 RepID=A0A8R1DEB6_CAEJA